MASKSLLSREMLQKKYNHARVYLLIMIALTLVNIVLVIRGTYKAYLFSASFPYLLLAVATLLEDALILAVCGTVAGISLLLYFLCWLFSKKHHGWMVAALIFFIFDILFLFGFYAFIASFPDIIDILVHIWVLYYLIIGVKYGVQLKKLPAEDLHPADDALDVDDADDDISTNSSSFRMADPEVKSRVLLETDHLGRHICYRRTKQTNELVVNGRIYDEINMLLETAHALTAVIDGHTITAGYDGKAYSYISVDGTVIARKRRFF